ncbi:hypothetical protein [Syntrophotalea acetylenica]|uniref:hypothetical protein n=1 Tax=Syntrophotalea acetylenica TaxID=29542 RepID=UPI002A369A60|nr:hypothetical protein [Syntrophotalea acetylenica]MDY0262977.1 hypothetical protein [Syntrophotalea acetylenica]
MTKKSEQENLQNVVFRMTPSEIDRVDKFAEKIGSTRSQCIRNLIIVGLEEAEIFEKFGLIRAGITVRDICGWMSEKVSRAISQEIDK